MADRLHRLIRLLESKGPRERLARIQGRAEYGMYVYDTTLLHLCTPTDRYHVVLVKIKQRFNICTRKQVTEAVRAILFYFNIRTYIYCSEGC